MKSGGALLCIADKLQLELRFKLFLLSEMSACRDYDNPCSANLFRYAAEWATELECRSHTLGFSTNLSTLSLSSVTTTPYFDGSSTYTEDLRSEDQASSRLAMQGF